MPKLFVNRKMAPAENLGGAVSLSRAAYASAGFRFALVPDGHVEIVPMHIIEVRILW
jgi:hypothetical protein